MACLPVCRWTYHQSKICRETGHLKEDTKVSILESGSTFFVVIFRLRVFLEKNKKDTPFNTKIKKQTKSIIYIYIFLSRTKCFFKKSHWPRPFTNYLPAVSVVAARWGYSKIDKKLIINLLYWKIIFVSASLSIRGRSQMTSSSLGGGGLKKMMHDGGGRCRAKDDVPFKIWFLGKISNNLI